jgi:hypothetical protein
VSEWIDVDVPAEPIRRLGPYRVRVMLPAIAPDGDYDIAIAFVVLGAITVEATLRASIQPRKSSLERLSIASLGSWDPAMSQANIKLIPREAHNLASLALDQLAEESDEPDILRLIAYACATPSNQPGFHRYPNRYLIEFAARVVVAQSRPPDDPEFEPYRGASLGPARRMQALGYPADRKTIRNWIEEARSAGYVDDDLSRLTPKGLSALHQLALADASSDT